MGMDAGERGEHFIMKKKIAMLLAAALCMGTFAGCGNSNTTQNGAENASQASATAKAAHQTTAAQQTTIRQIIRQLQQKVLT